MYNVVMYGLGILSIIMLFIAEFTSWKFMYIPSTILLIILLIMDIITLIKTRKLYKKFKKSKKR